MTGLGKKNQHTHPYLPTTLVRPYLLIPLHIAASCPLFLPTYSTMPPSTRAKNANQHPGHILLADVKKRHTKEQVSADAEKKRPDEETTRKALNNLHQFIANKEDMLAWHEVTDNEGILAPSLRSQPEVMDLEDKEACPPPLARQDAFILWDRPVSDDEDEVNVDEQGKQPDNVWGWPRLKETR